MKKKSLAVFALLSVLLIAAPSKIYATNTLDDVISQTESSVSNGSTYGNNNSTGTQSNSSSNSNNGFMETINDAAKINDHAQDISSGTSALQKGVTKLIQYISYATVILLSLSVALDIAYIAIPFTIVRNFLSGGAQGVAQQGGQQAGMGMGSTGGYGMGGYGMGGYGMGGYGAGRYGGMGSMGAGMGAQGQQGQPGMGHKRVHNAALNAVAASQTPGQNGKPANPFILYAKDMVVMLVLVPVLLILLLTGTLTDVGFFLGDKLTGIINNAV